MFPRLLYNFHQLNTFRFEQWKNFLKIEQCTAVKFDEFLLLCVYVTLLVFIFLFLLNFLPKTQKDQKYFCCFSSPFVYFGFLLLFCFICYRWFAIRKSKKILLCLLVSFCSCFQFENSKNICCSSLVCKVHYGVQRFPVAGAWFSFHIIQATQVKGNNDDLQQLDCGERLV